MVPEFPPPAVDSTTSAPQPTVTTKPGTPFRSSAIRLANKVAPAWRWIVYIVMVPLRWLRHTPQLLLDLRMDKQEKWYSKLRIGLTWPWWARPGRDGKPRTEPTQPSQEEKND